MDKPKIMEQTLNLNMIGGLTTEFKALENSNLSEKYEFLPLVLEKVHRKINIADIRFYYKRIKEYRPDIVQIRGAGVDGINAEIAAKLVPGTKILLCVHGMLSEADYISKIKYSLYRYIIEPLAFILADGISCVYEKGAERDQLKVFKKKLLPHVYNRMPDYSKINTVELRAKKRKELLYSDNDVVGIFCGRITYGKGITYLLETLKKMRDKWPERLRILFVGNGDYLETVETAIQNMGLTSKVCCVGEQKNVEEFLCAADFFLFPSLHENHSIALLEAIAMKLPIVATDVGGNGEIVHDGVEGILCKKRDTDAFRKGIENMLKDDYRRKYVNNIEKELYTQFSNKAVDEQLDKVLSLLLKDNERK